jgi:tRNA1Val (adenine37-N6)-methyltransferase
MADRHRVDGELTADTPAPGLTVCQPRRGYRWGVEVYALASFALDAPVGTAVDLGTGSGIVALLLAHQGVRVTAVERDPRWLAVARDNSVGWPVDVVEGDVRTWTGSAVDVVVCNPPWFDPAAGPVSGDSWKAASRTALAGTPEDFVRAGLRVSRRICVVGPRVVDLRDTHVARLARLGRLFLYEVRPGPGETRTEALGDVYVRWRSGGPPPP